eukprot:scaffold1083_cov376-Prasinococcus_capsulatus_cf.AAC.4
MKASIRNVASVLKPGGHLFVRDYAAGDLAQRRLQPKSKRQLDHSAELYVRGDGTRAFYFSEERIMELFACDELFTQQYEQPPCCSQPVSIVIRSESHLPSLLAP